MRVLVLLALIATVSTASAAGVEWRFGVIMFLSITETGRLKMVRGALATTNVLSVKHVVTVCTCLSIV